MEQFFSAEENGLNWIAFLNGYTKCCGRMTTSDSLNNLLRVFGSTTTKSGATTELQIDSSDGDYKINGHLLPADLLMLLWMCWAMYWDSRNSKGGVKFDLVDVNNLVLSAVSSCGDGGSELNVWDDSLLGSDIQLPIGKLHVCVENSA